MTVTFTLPVPGGLDEVTAAILIVVLLFAGLSFFIIKRTNLKAGLLLSAAATLSIIGLVGVAVTSPEMSFVVFVGGAILACLLGFFLVWHYLSKPQGG